MKNFWTLDGRVMDGAFFQEMLENVSDFGHDPSTEDLEISLYFWLEDATWSRAYSMVDGLFEDVRSMTAEEFYARLWEQTRLRCENYGWDGLSQDWMERAASIQKPFVYQDYWRGTTYLTDFFYILLGLLPVAAAVCMCTVFSEDRRTRVDALVFTTRKSRVPRTWPGFWWGQRRRRWREPSS